jgi:hypothetical protein
MQNVLPRRARGVFTQSLSHSVTQSLSFGTTYINFPLPKPLPKIDFWARFLPLFDPQSAFSLAPWGSDPLDVKMGKAI